MSIAAAAHLDIAAAALSPRQGWSVVLQLSLLDLCPAPPPPADWTPPSPPRRRPPRRRPPRRRPRRPRRAARTPAAPSTSTSPTPPAPGPPAQASLVDWLAAAPPPPPAGEVLSAAAQLERRIVSQRDSLRAQLAALPPGAPPRARAALQACIDDCCWRLVLPWRPLLHRTAARYAARAATAAARLDAQPYTAEELYSEALEEAFKAARRYDPRRSSCRFSTTMRRPVQARLRDLCRWRHARHAALGPLSRLDACRYDSPGAAVLGHDLTAADTTPTPEQALTAALAAPAARRRLAALLDRADLTARERQVLDLHHGLSADGTAEPLTFRELAPLIPCSKSTAAAAHTRALFKLRALL